MWADLQRYLQLWSTPEDPQRGEALPVHAVWETLLPELKSHPPPENSHGRAGWERFQLKENEGERDPT